jgi:hypothetical protein
MSNAYDESAWLSGIESAIAGQLDPDTERSLQYFLDRVKRHRQRQGGNCLSAAMSFLDAMDYEKRPWEDDSYVLWLALDNGGPDLADLMTHALASGDANTRTKASKWLPKYLAEDSAIALLTHVLQDSEAEVRWWAAIHLSRLAPETQGLVALLVEALHANWYCSARLCWDYDLYGEGEAAEALYHLGAAAVDAIPSLLAAIPKLYGYNAQLAARAVAGIAGVETALRLLKPLVSAQPALAKVIEELEQAERGEEAANSPDDPRHACFVARFIWRPGEDDYWRFSTRDARGAY